MKKNYLVEIKSSYGDEFEYKLITKEKAVDDIAYKLKAHGSQWTQSYRDALVAKMQIVGDGVIVSFPARMFDEAQEIKLDFARIHELYIMLHKHYEDSDVCFHLLQNAKEADRLQKRVRVLEDTLRKCRDDLETEVQLSRHDVWDDEEFNAFLEPYDEVLRAKGEAE